MHQQIRILAVCLILVQLVLSARAQTPSGTIRGAVRDSATHADLESATVTLYALPPASPGSPLNLAQVSGLVPLTTRRNTARGFTFRDLPAGNYLLIATYLGYLPDTARVTLKPGDSSGSPLILAQVSGLVPTRQVSGLVPTRQVSGLVPNLFLDLRRSARALMEVVVTARIPPAIVRNDTIAFNAAAYPTRPNATVEDLLRKLPGIDIDKNGNVTMQGQKVDKIYLDGKEFFLNDPRLATQNLPADIVDQIEAFDSQTERSRLTGVKETTGTKSINIKLKKNRRHGYFGKAYAGAGTGAPNDPSAIDQAYSAGATATSLGSSWLFGTGNMNNINNQFTGEENRNGPGSGGVQTFNNLNLNYSNNSDTRPGRFRRGHPIPAGDANPLTYTLNAGTSGSRTVLDQTSSTLTSLTDSSLLSNRSSRSASTTQSTQGNLFMEYNIDSFSLINLRSAVTQTTASSNETDSTTVSTLKPPQPGASLQTCACAIDNQGQTVNGSHSTDLNLNNQLNYRWRSRLPGRTLYVSLTESHDRQQQPQSTYSLVNNFDSLGQLLSQTLINQSIAQTAQTDGYSGSVAYTEPFKPGHLLDLSYRLNRTVSRSDRASDDYDSLTRRYDLPDSGTSNHFTAYNTIQRLGAGYNVTRGKFQYQLGLALQLSTLDNRNRTVDSLAQVSGLVTLRQTNWYPRASLIWTPGRGRSFRVNYNANTTSPTLQQLQPVADPTNPFLVKLGNPNLLQQLTHIVNAGYTSINTHTFENWQAGLQGSYSEHAITTSTTVLSGGIQQIQYFNVNGVWNSSGNLTYGFPLGDQRKGNSSLSLRGSYGRSVSGVNGTLDVTATLGWGADWKLNLHPTDRLFIESQAALNYTGNHYSLNSTQNTAAWLQTYTLDASYNFPGAVTLSTLYNLQVTGAQGSLPAQAVSQWNAAVYKDLGRRRNAQLRLSVFGILNNTHNITQTTGPGYASTSQTNLPGRIFLLSFVYHFRHFPGAGK